MCMAFETGSDQRVGGHQAELRTEVDHVLLAGKLLPVQWMIFKLIFPFFFNRDISHNKISTLEEGIFDNLFNLSEM